MTCIVPLESRVLPEPGIPQVKKSPYRFHISGQNLYAFNAVFGIPDSCEMMLPQNG